MDIKVIDIESEFYPTKLKEIDDPPQKLYVLGNEKILNDESLSIIGSRCCTEYGANIAKKFAMELAGRGICIVSGMAQGIDSCAHTGAIEAGGKTIAVLGSGFNHIFPDKIVFEKILANGGAVITEYNPNVEVTSNGFVRRNRIVAGMSIGTLVVEAKYRSGTAITASFAKSYGRKIFCIPHLIEDKTGYGPNKLIKNGAILVTEAEDILKHFKNVKDKVAKITPDVPQEYLSVYKQIQEKPLTSDEISKKLKLSISEVNTTLTMLELEGYIESKPGGFYSTIVLN